MLRLMCLLILAAGLYVFARTANAETLGCVPIGNVPYVINSPGVYCLDKNLYLTGNASAAIYITASQVTLDCNDRSITRYSPSTASYGILASGQSITKVRNCRVHLFPTGIALVNSESVEISNNWITNASSAGILVGGNGTGINVSDNVITNLYPHTMFATIGIALVQPTSFDGPNSDDPHWFPMASIVRNRILGGTTYYGLSIQAGEDIVVEGNIIHGKATGIRLRAGTNNKGVSIPTSAVIRNNNVFNDIGLDAAGAYVSARCDSNFIKGAIINCTSF